MKKILVLSLAAGVAAASASAQQSSAPSGQSNSMTAQPSGDLNMQRYKMALSDARKKLFAAGMSDLTPQQLEAFWAVYADFEKEKNALTTQRLDLAKKYADNFQNVSDSEITSLLTQSSDLQKKTVDLRMKYYGILSQKINAHAAGRFALIDDYTTTAARLNLLNQLPIPTGDGAQPASSKQ
ncbi:MAG TPA: hypothetical protein VFA98_12375 [Thermoanaerobaculia bacterium]|jgi:hypothetical protein|nr:hypothetical protein [Thermoanaerobaculia bacterium]